jgi:hypothetical protein
MITTLQQPISTIRLAAASGRIGKSKSRLEGGTAVWLEVVDRADTT